MTVAASWRAGGNAGQIVGRGGAVAPGDAPGDGFGGICAIIPAIILLQCGGGCVIAHVGPRVSGEGIARSLIYTGLLRSRPFQTGVRRGDGDGGGGGVRVWVGGWVRVRRCAVVCDGQCDRIRKCTSRSIVLGGNGNLNLVGSSRVLTVWGNVQSVIHNSHFQNAALVRVPIVTIILLILYRNEVFSIHANRQRNKIQPCLIFSFKLCRHINVGILSHGYGNLIRNNLEACHSIYTLSGRTV